MMLSSSMIKRPAFFKRIQRVHQIHKVCALLGPRQCGKTTLAEMYGKSFPGPVTRFDLEDPFDLAKLETPKLTLYPIEGLIIIDEIQLRPDLFPYLRVLVDRHPERRYLILGSASRDLIRQSSETLAGRIGYIELTPFQFAEVDHMRRLWNQGGFPLSYLTDDFELSVDWRKAYIRSFLERDLPAIAGGISPQEMRRLLSMLGHYHGNILNYSELGRSLGASDQTIRRYIQILEGAFMVRVLKPWFENIKKRQIKSPKVYIRDSGLLHVLLGQVYEEMALHPKVGASWEGFAIEEILRHHKIEAEDSYFWATTTGAELDLLLVLNGKRVGFEFKYTDAPKITRSMQVAIETLQLDALNIIIPLDGSFPLHEKIHVFGLPDYIKQHKEG